MFFFSIPILVSLVWMCSFICISKLSSLELLNYRDFIELSFSYSQGIWIFMNGWTTSTIVISQPLSPPPCARSTRIFSEKVFSYVSYIYKPFSNFTDFIRLFSYSQYNKVTSPFSIIIFLYFSERPVLSGILSCVRSLGSLLN